MIKKIEGAAYMYYGLIILAVVLFGAGFKLNDIYRKIQGNQNGIKTTLQYSLVCSAAGLVSLIFINGFKFEFTLFTFIMALITAFNGFGFSYCTFKSLGKINLSLYSLYSMLGGMVLPFFQGIIFFNERITLAKIICVILISIALIITVERGNKKNDGIYYAGIFTLNGLSGVISKFFTAAPYEKTSAEAYSIMVCLLSIIISFLALKIFFKNAEEQTQKTSIKAYCVGAFSGITNKIANLFLVIALLHVDASVQYPMITGGAMIVSTAICFFDKIKPSKKELLSVLFAFIGTLALFIIPI